MLFRSEGREGVAIVGSVLVDATGTSKSKSNVDAGAAGFAEQHDDAGDDASDGVDAPDDDGPASTRTRLTTEQQLHFPPRRQLHGFRSCETGKRV